jgi:hypothetical protein
MREVIQESGGENNRLETWIFLNITFLDGNVYDSLPLRPLCLGFRHLLGKKNSAQLWHRRRFYFWPRLIFSLYCGGLSFPLRSVHNVYGKSDGQNMKEILTNCLQPSVLQ